MGGRSSPLIGVGRAGGATGGGGCIAAGGCSTGGTTSKLRKTGVPIDETVELREKFSSKVSLGEIGLSSSTGTTFLGLPRLLGDAIVLPSVCREDGGVPFIGGGE